jgi:alkane 1-monooxygenase
MPWLSALCVFMGIPLLDYLIGRDRTAALSETVPRAIMWLRLVPRVYVFVWLIVLVWAAHILTLDSPPPATAAWLILSIAIASAFATCVAHELLHWPSAFDRALARVIMATVAYGQFPIEHLHHHAAVGLVHEGTTPRLGQSVWSFLAKNVAFTFRDAWRIEQRQQHSHRLSFAANRVVQQLVLTSIAVAVFIALGGASGLLLFLVQAALGIYTTEYVNYAQHYGLSRHPDAPAHGSLSWSSNGFLTNALTLNITRHAHHHMQDSIRYYDLENIASMPTLPAGYLALFFPAMAPPVWRRLMDSRAQPFAN